MTYVYPYPIRVGGYTLTVEQFAELYKRIKPDYTIVPDEDVFTGGTLGLALVNFGYKLREADIDAQSLGVFIDLPICRETLRVMLVSWISCLFRSVHESTHAYSRPSRP
ncbi:uncharacterized protein EV420DRAFT_1643106 [Desarmillaria tabescens]|uniref:Uncharacterized protein n=1 Tax=Armillaria tabescens TaxID=1929756 RepID=A0AA39KBQ8_ARMTA|nr:uncharacterized protein EV420DRAFT_1643106 [Desarmillaria tabescens]KAK0458226.1 hypothetical protein EV420DRAFT_1643106 [Desarmillaria tabescens]